MIKHSLGVVWDQIADFRDTSRRQIDEAVRAAMFLHFGEVSDEDVRKGGLIKSYPDRDEYLYRGHPFVTVYRPAPRWNDGKTTLSLEYHIETMPKRVGPCSK